MDDNIATVFQQNSIQMVNGVAKKREREREREREKERQNIIDNKNRNQLFYMPTFARALRIYDDFYYSFAILNVFISARAPYTYLYTLTFEFKTKFYYAFRVFEMQIEKN